MPFSFLKNCRQRFEQLFSFSDRLFFVLRLATIVGSSAWLLFAPVSVADSQGYFIALFIFIIYSGVLYGLIFCRADRIRQIYVLSLVFDLIFVYCLVRLENRVDNSFFLGYYLLVVLHTLYFGRVFGLFVTTLAAGLYLLNVLPFLGQIHWTAIGVRIIFLYLIGLPAGLIHEKLKTDKEKIEQLNAQLSETLENLERMQAKLIESEKLSALGRLTAGVAHEIRNPLTALGGFSKRLLARLPEGSQEYRYARTIIAEVNRLEAILRDIMIVISKGGELNRADINQVVRHGVSFYLGLYRGEQKLEVRELYRDDLPRVYLEPNQVEQAIGNLISNALDSMPEGGTLTIRTDMKKSSEIEWVVVSITDTGTGISREQTALIFEPFYSTKRIGTGTGLGLTIVRQIMEDHRGFIEVHSAEGGGTAVTLCFPYQPEEEDARTPCWKCLGCGVEKDPSFRCPAYPYFGRICWAVAGTLCAGKVMGTYAEKIRDCRKCPFFMRRHNIPGQEGDIPSCLSAPEGEGGGGVS
ncbi:sensor histidine kinase [Desulfolithobacter sp.]